MRSVQLSSLCLVIAFAIPGCAGYQTFLEDQVDMTPVDGTVEASGDPLGSWTMHAESCESGMREGFYGVTIFAQNKTRAVRVVRNPVGPMTIAVSVPGSDDFVAVPCRAVVGTISRTGTRINSIPVVSGNVRFSCNGLRGAATFTCS